MVAELDDQRILKSQMRNDNERSLQNLVELAARGAERRNAADSLITISVRSRLEYETPIALWIGPAPA
jgi:hypothetical protein